MMTMNFLERITVLLSCFVLLSCEPEPIDSVINESKSISLMLENPEDYETRSSYGDDIETVFSGAVLAIYNSENGIIDSKIEISPDKLGTNINLSLPVSNSYDFYLLANIWKIDKESSEPRAIDLPYSSDEMKNYFYRLDSGSIDDRFRRESMDEISEYGIPMAWSATDVNIQSTPHLNMRMERLFSKLILTIDHRGLSGDKLDSFINGSVFINNVNNKLMPFAENGSKAEVPEDVCERGDYISKMENGLLCSFVFYVPENRQGCLLPGNSNPNRKTPETISSRYGSEFVGNLSYLSFSAELSAESAGVSAMTNYRFYLGQDASSDFDIRRNELMEVGLKFNAESIFHPTWKINTSELSDSRQFYLSAQKVSRLYENQIVVVRKNRPARIQLELRLNASSGNRINDAKLVNYDYDAENINDLAWASNCWSLGHRPNDEPARVAMADCGIDVQYSNGSFTFTVTDETKFVVGKTFALIFNLYPGNKRARVIIKTMEDISVSEKDGKSLVDTFYIAQKRTLVFKGFASSKIYYAPIQPRNGRDDTEYVEENVHWKRSELDEDPFPKAYFTPSDYLKHPLYYPELYENQILYPGEELDMYAWRHNHYNTINAYVQLMKNASGTLVLCPEDVLNDDEIRLEYKILGLPFSFRYGAQVMNMYLPYDCRKTDLLKETKTKYYIKSNGENRLCTRDDFIPSLYDRFVADSVSVIDRSGWLELVDWDISTNILQLRSTKLDGRDISELGHRGVIAEIRVFRQPLLYFNMYEYEIYELMLDMDGKYPDPVD